MSEWNETWLRSAANWKAFKEGKALADAGMVAQAKFGTTGWQGTVKDGKRTLRVAVIVRGPHDVDTRCSCPENQSSGALCAHAVAVGLQAMKPAASPAEATSPTGRAEPALAASRAFSVQFPPNWQAALVRGSLAVTLLSSDDAPSRADDALVAWLVAQGERSSTKPLVLHLSGVTLLACLAALDDHPRILAGGKPVGISQARAAIASATRRGEEILLEGERGGWLKLMDQWWRMDGEHQLLQRIGAPPVELQELFAAWSLGKAAHIATEAFIAHIEFWQQWLAIDDHSWLAGLHFVPAPAQFTLRLDGSLQWLRACIEVIYPGGKPQRLGSVAANLPRAGSAPDQWLVQDRAAERQAAARLIGAGFVQRDDHFELRGEPSIMAFLANGLPAMRGDWKLIEEDRFKRQHSQVHVVAPQIQLLGSGDDWLAFDFFGVTGDGERIAHQEIAGLLRSGRNSKLRRDGQKLMLPSSLGDAIEPLFSELDLRQEHGHWRASKAAALVIEQLSHELARSGASAGHTTHEPVPTTLKAALRPYQHVGFSWLHQRTKQFGGALLADDMGLGKTLQAIALIESLFEAQAGRGVVLVLATTSLLGNWAAEFSRFAPQRRVHVLHGAKRDAIKERLGDGDVVITSYGTLARDLAWHLQREYLAVVADEASLLRNPDTDHAKAVAKLNSAHRIALTGTPVENGVRDLWSIFRFIQPGWLGSREQFKETYELPCQESPQRALLQRLRWKTSPFILRRTKEEVAPELPGKLIIDEFVDLSPQQRTLYQSLQRSGLKLIEELNDQKQKGAARMQMLTALLRLRQTCCDMALVDGERSSELSVPQRSAKMERLLELLEDALSANHKVLIFSQFQKQLLEIKKLLDARKWESLVLTGETRNRQDLVDRFQSAGGPPLFLISLKAGGYGLNLTAADTVVHFDPWWNPAAEAQANDRAHRIGQTRPVTVYRLLTRHTVEEKVLHMQSRKRELATAAIDEGGLGDAGSLTEGELGDLLRD